MKDGIPTRPGLKGLGNFTASVPSVAEIGTKKQKVLMEQHKEE